MTHQNVTKLKELLFDKESRELDALRHSLDAVSRNEARERGELQRRIDELAERTGGDAQLQRSVARILDGALRDAEPEHHNALADALAPMVRRTFRAEIKTETTQEELTSALYPKIGEMIRRFMASAMRDMMETINRRLEGGLTNNRLVLKLRSVMSGRSMAELALADTQRFTVEELYLIRRGSGELIRRWSNTPDLRAIPQTAGAQDFNRASNRDTLISGFLTAITAFAEEAFANDKSSLRSLDLDDHRIYLRASPAHLLAAKCSGTAEAAVEQVLDSELLTLLGAHQKTEIMKGPDGKQPSAEATGRAHERILTDFSQHIEERIGAAEAEIKKSRGSLRPLKIMALMFGLPLLLYAGWQSFITYQTTELQRAVDAAVGELPELGGYPVKARVERGGHTIWVGGLVPTPAARTELLGRIKTAAPAAVMTETIGVLPATDVRGALQAESVRRSVDVAQRRLETLGPEFERTAIRFEPGPQRDAIEDAARTTAQSTLAIGQSGADQSVLLERLQEAIRRMRAATRQLAALAGASAGQSAANDVAIPSTAVASADELAVAAERMSAQIMALEQLRVVTPLERRNAELSARLDALIKRLEPAPRDALAAYLRTTAIFFSNGVEYRDASMTKEALDGVVRLAQQTDLLVRVVGYTDEAGDPKRNQALSQQRADKVTDDLVARGLPRARIVAVGRGTAMDVAPKVGVTSANRRVEFEIGFPGEEGGPQ